MRFFRQPVLVLALLGVAVTVPALAQQPSLYPSPCDASKVSKADVDRAHTLYLSGKQFLDESNYDKAIGYFKDAYSIDCSVHAILPIIATAYERKGDKLEAIRALEEYLKRAPSAGDHEVIERRIANLKQQVASLGTTAATASAPPPSATVAAPPPSASTPPPQPPPSSEPTTTAPAGALSTPPPPAGGGHSIAPWVLVGVGAAAVVTGVVLLAVGSGDVSSAEGQCGSAHNMCPPGSNAINTGNTGRTLEGAGYVVGGVGLAAAAGGLVWHFVEPTSPTVGNFLTPSVGPGYGGISFAARF
jgi:tetratricopeptide (TPR) repeat protein